MQHIFLETYQAVLVYSRRDKRLMERVAQDMKAAGVTLWTGSHLKVESDYWQSSVEQALSEVEGVIVLLTPNARFSPEVRVMLQLAQRQELPIYPLWLQGEMGEVMPDELKGVKVFDVRNQAAFFQNLAPQEVVESILNPPQLTEWRMEAWNPLHQLRLLLWTCWQPRKVVDYQETYGAEDVRRTAKWLATWLVFGALLLGFIQSEFHQLRLGSVLRIGVGLFFGVYLAVAIQQERRFWLNYRHSAWVAVGVLVFILPILLWIIVDYYPLFLTVRPAQWILAICVVIISGIALGIGETFQARGNLVVVVVIMNILTAAMSAVWVAAGAVIGGVGTGIGAVGLLALLGISAGIVALLILYAFGFLLANELVKALYIRNKASRWGRFLPVFIGLNYMTILISGLF